jgi:hypothetical protein
MGMNHLKTTSFIIKSTRATLRLKPRHSKEKTINTESYTTNGVRESVGIRIQTYNQLNPLVTYEAICHHTNLTHLFVITICQMTIATKNIWRHRKTHIILLQKTFYWRKVWMLIKIYQHAILRFWTNDTITLWSPTNFHGGHVGTRDMGLKCASVGRAVCAGSMLIPCRKIMN